MLMIELLENKLEEYGIEIINKHIIEKVGYIMTPDMALSYDYNLERLSVSFHAGTVPDRVANNILILQEIEGLNKNFRIMESFTHDENGKIVSGIKAHVENEKRIGNKYIENYKRKEESFRQLLDMDPVGRA